MFFLSIVTTTIVCHILSYSVKYINFSAIAELSTFGCCSSLHRVLYVGIRSQYDILSGFLSRSHIFNYFKYFISTAFYRFLHVLSVRRSTVPTLLNNSNPIISYHVHESFFHVGVLFYLFLATVFDFIKIISCLSAVSNLDFNLSGALGSACIEEYFLF